MAAQVLVVGGGGREHVLAVKLADSAHIGHVFVAPGNAGTKLQNPERITNAEINVGDQLATWCTSRGIDLVVVGPEAPLANGIADSLASVGVACFGPTAAAAKIETSKQFAKEFMMRYAIPTARFQAFSDVKAACHHIDSADYQALVVKASGLAAGKGVVVAATKDEAKQAVKEILEDKKFGVAGDVVVVEELLEGEEVSMFAFSDGQCIAVMPPSQDHKRLLEGNTGPMTGGVGAYSPCPQVSSQLIDDIETRILQPAIDGLRKDGTPYIGLLYAGLMLTKSGPFVLEFNCRFGDPEAQAVLPLMESDLYLTAKACVDGNLSNAMPSFQLDHFSVSVVMSSQGYPGAYPTGKVITGISDANSIPGVHVSHAGTKLTEDSQIVTSGGRVLTVSATASSLKEAVDLAYKGVGCVKFDGAQYRKDIASLAMKSLHFVESITYEVAGVNINAGNELVAAIRPLAKATARSGCSAELGGFGGFFDCKAAGYKDPLLVSGTDGVGTKLKIAQQCGIHNTVGIDLVAMCVNDVLAHGAEPLFFLDYFACGKLDVDTAKSVIAGVADGCQQAGCALLGGETAEMPGLYSPGEYDLAGFTVGAVEREYVLPRMSTIKVGDAVIGLESSGLHSNGFSLVRKLVDGLSINYDSHVSYPLVDEMSIGKSLGEVLLTPTHIYCKPLRSLLQSGMIKAVAHITGGGLVENIPRVLPPQLSVALSATKWSIPGLFGWIASAARLSGNEMSKTFNCGIGLVLIVGKEYSAQVSTSLHFKACEIGEVTERKAGAQPVVISDLDTALSAAYPLPDPRAIVSQPSLRDGSCQTKKVGVLISGTGTNLQALIDSTKQPSCDYAKIVLVISNVPGVEGLKKAERAGIPNKVISHKQYKKRREFDAVVHEALIKAGVEIVCLAGFMRIVGAEFVGLWRGRLLNIHPTLLPSFPGIHPHEQVLAAGARVSGCTVHFVEEVVDAGGIIVQEAVPVLPNDTPETLGTRVRQSEHRAYPEALKLLATGKVSRGEGTKVVWKP